jgi:DNA-binding LytR/AlgR family response regulator
MFFKTNRSFIVNLTWVESIKPASRTAYQVFFRGTMPALICKKTGMKIQVKDQKSRQGVKELSAS